jgi:oligopeptidase B
LEQEVPHKTRVHVALPIFLAVTAVALGPWTWAAEPPQQVHTPPKATKIPKILEMHGERRVDDYFWMNDRTDPKVVEYLGAENAYAAEIMKPTAKLQARLYEEMAGRLRPDEESLPVEDNGYVYYTRYSVGKEYPIYCRRKASPAAEEEIMLNVNVLAAGHKLYKATGLTVSPDNRVLAFGVDTAGDRMYTVFFKDLAAGKMLPDEIPGTSAEVAWAADGRTVFYTTNDATVRAYRLMRHILGEPLERDVVLLQEADVKFELSLKLSKSRKYVLVGSSSETSSEYRYLDSSNPQGELVVFQARTPNLLYWVEHGGEKFYIRTDLNAPNFRLMEADPGKTAKENWRPVVAYRPSVLLEEFDVFKGYLVLVERAGGLPRLRVIGLSGGKDRTVAFEDAAYDAGLEMNPRFESRTLRFHYSSPIVPSSIYEYDMPSGTKTLLKRDQVFGGYDPARYEVRRLAARAADGTRVPISLVFRKGMRRNGSNPLLLVGYGAYGSTNYFCDLDFQPERISLLDRGFVYAIAHVRGGQGLGRAWYENGKLLHKKNTYSDFIACADYLVAHRYTDPKRMFANGMSAGGMLMAVVANWRPDLFRGIVAEVPWTDVVTDSLNPDLPLTTVEYEEWGDPSSRDVFDYLLSYSPYDNVKAQAYPTMLVTAAFNDTQVPYWSPAKWVAKLREMKTDDNVILLVTNMASGHSGASGRLERFKLTAMKYAFMLNLLGMTE